MTNSSQIQATGVNNATENRSLLRFFGQAEADRPSGHIGKHLTVVSDGLETLLLDDWPEWQVARAALISQGRGIDGKNAETYRLAARKADGSP